jgi:putative endonuclease
MPFGGRPPHHPGFREAEDRDPETPAPAVTYSVYILASSRHGTLYVGVTNSLQRRVEEHRAKEIPGFTQRYGVTRLVYFQGFGDVSDAILYEKRLKRWRRDWKIRLIEEDNPHWEDLYLNLIAPSAEPPREWIPDIRCADSGMTDEDMGKLKERWALKL